MIFALKNLRRRLVRTLLSILGVGVGVASIIGFTAVANGFKESVNEYARQSGADLIVYDKAVPDPSWGRVKKSEMEALRQVPNVEDVSASSVMPSLIKGMPAILVLGRYPNERLMQFYARNLKEGRLLQLPTEAMLGSVAAQQLQKKPGDEVVVLGEKFTVVGIYATNVSFENGGMVIHMDALRRHLRSLPDDVGMAAFVYLKNPDLRDETAREIERRFERFRAVRTLEVVMQFDLIQYVDAIVWIISVGAVIVGAIMVLNTLLMSISERVREIGTLRAFGWSRGRVMRLIWSEGFVISVLGGFVGMALGVAGAEILMRLIPQGYLETSYTPFSFVKGMSIAVGVGLISAAYPAYWASRLPPAEALRYE